MSLEEIILRDAMAVTLIGLVSGLVVYALIRRNNPEMNWSSRGNVWTQPFGVADLPVVGILLLVFSAGLFIANGDADSEAANAEEGAFEIQEALFGMVFYFFLLAAVLFFIGFIRMRNLVEVFGLTRLKPGRVLLFGVVAMVIVYPVILTTMYLVQEWIPESLAGEFQQQESVKALRESDSWGLKIALVFFACIVAPVVEEFIFRGYMYPVIKRFSDLPFAAIFSSAVFAAVHLNAISLGPLFVLALCFTVAYEMTGCLLVPIVMHAIFNTTTVVLTFGFPNFFSGS